MLTRIERIQGPLHALYINDVLVFEGSYQECLNEEARRISRMLKGV